ncbi:MAG: T9SS type A sorting domain-containing protein [Bacteroidetes bacterium]|nr:T9SS type A sorting domain-containing protein [Bacteroidota bacterium]
MQNLTHSKSLFLLKISLVTAFVIGSFNLFATDIKLEPTKKNSVSITENTYNKLSLKTKLNDLSYLKVNTKNGLFAELGINEYSSSLTVGAPKLPVLKKLIEIPLGATIQVNVISFKVQEYNLEDLGIDFPIIPYQASVSKSHIGDVPFNYNSTIYTKNEFFGNELVTVDEVGMMRSTRMGRLNISPIQYNPVTKKIKVYSEIVVDIVFENPNIAATIQLKNDKWSPYFEGANTQLFNYKPLESKVNVTSYPVKYVIVAPIMFQAALQPFIQWKTKKGFTVVEAYTNNPLVGSTTTSIQNYLHGLYTAGTASDPAPSFVLFVGDVAQIPSFAGTTGTHVSDLYYCEYTSDMIPEVYYGRFSATTVGELTPQIDKTLEYEQYLMPTKTFLDSCVMIAGQDPTYGPLHGDGQINYGTSTYFNASNGLYSNTYLYAVSGTSSAQIINNVSKGVCYANYTAHGGPDGWSSPGFSNANVTTLENAHKYPLMVGNCCLTNKFDDALCFGEALLRANNKGAIGYIGGSNSTYWDEDYFWGVGARGTISVTPTYMSSSLGSYDRTFHTHGEPFSEWFATQGQMVSAGNLAVTQSGSSVPYYWEIYHLMGDPSLMVYFSEPSAMTVTYLPLIPVGSTSITVNTNVPFSYAAISKNGVLLGAALSDTNGVAIVPTPSLSVPGYVSVVVTKQNRQPFIDSVLVASPAGPYVIYNNNQLADNTGNNNGLADFGENITLNVGLKNVGNSAANGVNAVLSTTDPNVVITDNTQSYGTIASSAISTQTSAYGFSVNALIPDEHMVPFTLNITDGSSNTWNGSFNIKLYAPKLVAGSISVSDPLPGGNNNGRLDAGETATITIVSSNNGHANAANTTGLLSTTSAFLTVNSANYNFNTLNLGTSINGTFSVTVSSSVTDGTIIPLNYLLSSSPYSDNETYNLIIGVVVEDWECAGFNHFDWINGGDAPWTITTVLPYNGVDCAQSGVIVDDQTSLLSIDVNVVSSDSISFFKKVSCEYGQGSASWWDYLAFLVDDVVVGQWDGEVAWSKSSFIIPTGVHNLKWLYFKDGSVSSGSDAAWIDDITFPPITTIISVEENTYDNDFNLSCYPNPIQSNSVISYTIPASSNVNLSIYNAIGQLVLQPLNETQSKGKHSIEFNAGNLNSGVYMLVLKTSEKTISKKITIK